MGLGMLADMMHGLFNRKNSWTACRFMWAPTCRHAQTTERMKWHQVCTPSYQITSTTHLVSICTDKGLKIGLLCSMQSHNHQNI